MPQVGCLAVASWRRCSTL